jgi:hypothetical protein
MRDLSFVKFSLTLTRATFDISYRRDYRDRTVYSLERNTRVR